MVFHHMLPAFPWTDASPAWCQSGLGLTRCHRCLVDLMQWGTGPQIVALLSIIRVELHDPLNPPFQKYILKRPNWVGYWPWVPPEWGSNGDQYHFSEVNSFHSTFIQNSESESSNSRQQLSHLTPLFPDPAEWQLRANFCLQLRAHILQQLP